ncbi:MAG: hypothetical protein DMG41_27140 [Acidobacteria bacterium]|nr:MAG: hypothetical protein DMG41_27140 [Acidobacteriota bacterium]
MRFYYPVGEVETTNGGEEFENGTVRKRTGAGEAARGRELFCVHVRHFLAGRAGSGGAKTVARGTRAEIQRDPDVSGDVAGAGGKRNPANASCGWRQRVRDLFSRMRRIRAGARWYATLLLPPALMLTVLLCLKTLVSPVYAPNRFFVGVSFGIVAGLFEEIGWTGYAFPKMARTGNGLGAAIALAMLWGTWHIPVIDYLGTATPHGAHWLGYFLAFTAAMTAMRVLIAWIYANTKSVALAQFMHASSTGSLVVLSPGAVTARQETAWYAVYAAALWLIVALVAAGYGPQLTREPRKEKKAQRWADRRWNEASGPC